MKKKLKKPNIRIVDHKDGGMSFFAEGGSVPIPSLQSASKLKLQRQREEEVRQKELEVVKNRKPIATAKPILDNKYFTDTTQPGFPTGYTAEEQKYFIDNKIPTGQWAETKTKLDNQAIVERRKQINEQAGKDLAAGNFTTARAENLGNAFRFFPDDANSFVDNYLNPFQMVGSMAGNLGEHFASDRVQPKNLKEAGQDALSFLGAVGSPLLAGRLATIGANNTGQFINNLANPFAGTGTFLTTKTPLKNAYKLNPFATKTPTEVLLHRVQKPGQTGEYLIGQNYASKPLESLSLEQKIKAMKSNQPGFGRGFSSDINDVSYYSNPNIMEARGYSGNPEILRMRVPTNKLDEFSIANYNKTREAGDTYRSLKPDKEFIMPIDMIQNAEKFSINDLAKLKEEFNAVNTPDWLKGYKPIGQPKVNPISNFASGVKSYGQDLAYSLKNNRGLPTYKNVTRWEADEIPEFLKQGNNELTKQQKELTGSWYTHKPQDQLGFYMQTRPGAGNVNVLRMSERQIKELENVMPEYAKGMSGKTTSLNTADDFLKGELVVPQSMRNKAKSFRFDVNPSNYMIPNGIDPSSNYGRAIIGNFTNDFINSNYGNILGLLPRKYFPFEEGGGIELANRMYEEGGEYELSQEEIQDLKNQGYDIELL